MAIAALPPNLYEEATTAAATDTYATTTDCSASTTPVGDYSVTWTPSYTAPQALDTMPANETESDTYTMPDYKPTAPTPPYPFVGNDSRPNYTASDYKPATPTAPYPSVGNGSAANYTTSSPGIQYTGAAVLNLGAVGAVVHVLVLAAAMFML
ncbi:uncharacterized protein BP5553_02852 [Venustampulla echinocandica]|uniref:Uncharacterized protein n=1 Tax=Venustampulla echinocandica TaxID=2656787 RepID=A0A370TSK1_9HELO|nr:uncharacterized protein BP5553_02852 [Venustampulla echinocandica]RDL38512.1 hypothetical protein BP5553_02852 [Venustampulla echinocandica]